MRTISAGLLLVMVGCLSAFGDVVYSFSQPASGPAVGPVPAVEFSFTVPSLLTSRTTIPGGKVDAPLINYMGHDLSIQSVTIDPGLDNTAVWVGSRGVGYVGLTAGVGDLSVFGEGVCFASSFSCYSSLPAPADAEPFSHFGTYVFRDITLSISSTDIAGTAAPEPRFEVAVGIAMLFSVLIIAVHHRSHHVNLREQAGISQL